MILGNFRQFDYGNDEKNYRMYNSVQPPEYKLDKIIAPIAFFSSVDDIIATKPVIKLFYITNIHDIYIRNLNIYYF